MRYRIHFEPIDIEIDKLPDDLRKVLMLALLADDLSVRKCVPVDDEGFPISLG